MWSLLSSVQLYGACQAGVKGTSLSSSPNPAFSIRLFSFPSSHVRGVDFYLLSSSAFCWLRKSGKCVPHSIHARCQLCRKWWHAAHSEYPLDSLLWEMAPEGGSQKSAGKIPFPPTQSTSCTCHYCWQVWTTNAARAKMFREWKLKELRSRTYRALGSLKTQQGNLPTKKKTWQYVFRSSIHHKEVWGVNIYARCMLVDGQAAWFGTARENRPVTNHGQGWHSSSVLLLCTLWAWLRAC